MTMQTINASASPEVQMNENFETLSHQSVYGKRHPVTTGLVWGYGGGQWGGIAITAGTVTLTNAATNYIVVLKSTGAISVSTASTNWDNTELYARVYKLTTAGSVVTATEDHRAGLYGVMGFDTTILAANEATDTSSFIAFVTAASGQLQIKTNTNLTFNSNTGMLTSLAATITTLTATNLSDTVPTTGWYSPSADNIRTPNSVTVDDALTVGAASQITGKLTVVSGNVRLSNAFYLSGNLAAGAETALIGRTVGNLVSIDPDAYGTVLGGTLTVSGTTTSSGSSGVPKVGFTISGTGAAAHEFTGSNTGGAFTFGLSRNDGLAPFNTGSAYSSFFATTNSTALVLGTNSTKALTIDTSQNTTLAGTLTVSGATSAIGNTVSSTSNLVLSAGVTGVSSLRIPHGAAPTSPVDGDMWTTTAGLYVRVNGATVGPLT